jgi:hypothetical protein
MVRTVLKLVVVALLANAGWHMSQAWLAYFKFKDAVTSTSLYGGDRSIQQIHDRVMELASEYSVPVPEDGFTVRRDEKHHTFIDGSYTQQIELLPGRSYPWTFSVHIDTHPRGPTN